MEGVPWRMTCCLPLLVSFSLFVGDAHKHEEKTRRYQVPFESSRLTSPWSEPFVQRSVSPERTFPLIPSPRTSEQAFTSFAPSGVASQPEQFAGNQQIGSTATTVPIVPNEMFSDTVDNRDEMSPESFSFLDGQLSSGASPNGEYFDSSYAQDPGVDLNSTEDDSGPTREEMDVIRPFIDSDNKLAQAIINDTWAQDKELTSSRQAVSEGLVTSHVLANAALKNKPVVKEKSSKKINNKVLKTNAFSSATGHYAFLPLTNFHNPTPQFSNSNHEQNLTSTTHSKNFHLEKRKNKTEFKLDDHSLSLKPSHFMVSVNLEKVGGRKPTTPDSRNDWFTTPKIPLSNHSTENTTTSNFSSGQRDKNIMKTFTAADYLKSLYPQLSIFKAPFKIDEEAISNALSALEKLQMSLSASKNLTVPNKLRTLNPSLNSSATKASVLLSLPSLSATRSSLLPANKTLATRKEITTEASRRFKEETSRFAKNSAKTRMKIKEAFLKLLLKLHPTVRPAPDSITNVSIIRNAEVQRYISSALSHMLITRNKNRGQDKSSYRYLTEAGAKLVPGHIFSPIGSDFSDGLEPTPVPSSGTSIRSTVSSVRIPMNQASAPAINPTQTGSIPAETTTQGTEVSIAPVIIPTQSGRVQTVSKTAGQIQTEVVTETPTENLPEVSVTSKKFASPTTSITLATKTSPKMVVIPTQAGFIPTQPQTPKTILSTKSASYVPTQSGLISTNTDLKRRDRTKNEINAKKRKIQNKTWLPNDLLKNSETIQRRAFERGEVATKRFQYNMDTSANDRHFQQHNIERQLDASSRSESSLFKNPFAESGSAHARVPFAESLRIPARAKIPFAESSPARRRVPFAESLRIPARTRVSLAKSSSARTRVPFAKSSPARPRVPFAESSPALTRVPFAESLRIPARTRLSLAKSSSERTSVPFAKSLPARPRVPFAESSPARPRVPFAESSPAHTRVPFSQSSPARTRVPFSESSPARTRVSLAKSSSARTRVPFAKSSPARPRVPFAESSPARSRVPFAESLPASTRVSFAKSSPARARVSFTESLQARARVPFAESLPARTRVPFAESSPARARVRRQMFLPVPLMQANSLNAQQYNQPLLPAQQLIPNLVPAQLPSQQFIPTQPVQPFLPQVALPLAPLSPFVQPDLRSQFPFQQAIDQRSLAAQTQNSLIPFGAPPSPPMAAFNQMPNTLPVSMNQLQQMFPNRASQNMQSYPQREMRPMQPAALSPVTVNVPLPPPKKIPSFLAASEVYRDFQDVNSKSHLEDDILANPLSHGEYTPEDDLKEEQKYNNFAYESDKKNWDTVNELPEEEEDIATVDESKGGNLQYASDETNDFNSLAEQSDFDEQRPLSDLRYVTGGRRHHRPKHHHHHHHHKHHWLEEDSLGSRVNSKGIIRHKEGKIVEISDGKFHPAEDTTENAFKDSPYKTPAESDQQEDRLRSDDENLWTSQLEKSSPTDSTDASHSEEITGINQSEPNESDEDINTNQADSSNGENESSENPSDDKNERHEELRDGSEDAVPDEAENVASSPAPVALVRQAMSPSLTSWKEELVNKLSRSAVMHLTFDDALVKPADKTVQDKSGNENDATLQNGAQISNRTMGTCGRVVILKEGEVIYKADRFTKKPTKAASIAMWVKSRKPGLVRWFDVGDNGAGSAQKPRESGKLVKVPRNQWIHLAGTFDSATGVARVYANGRLISETVGQKNQGLPEDFTATGIGQKFGDKFISFLDDVYMFDRVISPTEVKILYKKCEFNRMILHFGFQNINTTTHQVMDQSGLDNNGTIQGGAHTLNSGCDKCGACLDASSGNSPGVYLDGRRFHHKPTAAISVSSWVSLNKTKGQHAIFQVVSNKNDEWHEIYILEVIDGKLHWGNKNPSGDSIFDVKTDEIVIPEGLWSHVTATYNSESGEAKVFVNGLLKSSHTDYNKSKLSDAWGRVTIGGHLPDAKSFEGLLDEFFIYNWELDPSEVRFVLKYCADHPKLVSFTVRVPLFKRQRIESHHTHQAVI